MFRTPTQNLTRLLVLSLLSLLLIGAGLPLAGHADAATECSGETVTVDLSLGEVPTDGDDVIRGTNGNDVIDGLGGNDLICARSGDDQVSGGHGNDEIYGQNGNDIITGGYGYDVLFGQDGDDVIDGEGNDDEIDGGEGNDTINGRSGNDTLRGDLGNDTILGGAGADTIDGGPGHDQLEGQNGNDFIAGAAGTDNIDGGNGADVLEGGAGTDNMVGGDGYDSADGGTGEDTCDAETYTSCTPPPPPPPLPIVGVDQRRMDEVSQVVRAFEGWAAVDGDYVIDGSGAYGDGYSWFRTLKSTHPKNLAVSLVEAGFLQGGPYVPRDPNDFRDESELHQSDDDFLVYQCADRVAVFANPYRVKSDPADAQWWADNGCRAPGRSGHEYMQLSAAVSDLVQHDQLRLVAVDEIVVALEHWASVNGTFRVENTGYFSGGYGRFHASEGDYSQSIAGVLISQGYLDPEAPPFDPQHLPRDGKPHEFDFRIFPCAGRAGVFSRTHGSIFTDPADVQWWDAHETSSEQWWLENGCPTIEDPSDRVYFRLTEPLDLIFEPAGAEQPPLPPFPAPDEPDAIDVCSVLLAGVPIYDPASANAGQIVSSRADVVFGHSLSGEAESKIGRPDALLPSAYVWVPDGYRVAGSGQINVNHTNFGVGLQPVYPTSYVGRDESTIVEFDRVPTITAGQWRVLGHPTGHFYPVSAMITDVVTDGYVTWDLEIDAIPVGNSPPPPAPVPCVVRSNEEVAFWGLSVFNIGATLALGIAGAIGGLLDAAILLAQTAFDAVAAQYGPITALRDFLTDFDTYKALAELLFPVDCLSVGSGVSLSECGSQLVQYLPYYDCWQATGGDFSIGTLAGCAADVLTVGTKVNTIILPDHQIRHAIKRVDIGDFDAAGRRFDSIDANGFRHFSHSDGSRTIVRPDFTEIHYKLDGSLGVRTIDGARFDVPAGRFSSCNSFPTGTEVRLADGTYKTIEAIAAGDTVLSYDFGQGTWVPGSVMRQWSAQDEGVIATAHLSDGSSVSATDDHRFWVESTSEWTELDEVEPGSLLFTPSGTPAVAEVTLSAETATVVWELSVFETNNFTVRAGAHDLLVHNCGEIKVLQDANGNTYVQRTGADGDAITEVFVDRTVVVRWDEGANTEITTIQANGTQLVQTTVVDPETGDAVLTTTHPDLSQLTEYPDGTTEFRVSASNALASAQSKGWNGDDLDAWEMENLYRHTKSGSINESPFGESFDYLHARGYRWDNATKKWRKPDGNPVTDRIAALAPDARSRVVVPDATSIRLTPGSFPDGSRLSHGVGLGGEKLTAGKVDADPNLQRIGGKSERIVVTIQPASGPPVTFEVRPDLVAIDLNTQKLVAIESKARLVGSGDPALTANQALFYDALRGGPDSGTITNVDFSNASREVQDAAREGFGRAEIYHWELTDPARP